MKPEWISFYLFGLSVLIQLGLYISQVFLVPRGFLLRPFQLNEPLSTELKHFVIARGWVDLFLAVIIIVGLRYIFKVEIKLAGVVTAFAGVGILIQSFALLFQSKKYWPLVSIQSGPILLGFFFLAFHIRGS